MTRKKKTRSLKRIFSIKTGNKAKLKRASDNDRQNSARFSKTTKKQKSAYQKFVDENPESSEQKVNAPKETVSVAPEYIEVNKPLKQQTKPKVQTPNQEENLFDLFERTNLDDFQ